MRDLIEELKMADVKVMPILHDGKTIHHIKEYTTKFENGLSNEEFTYWLNKGYNGLCVFMSKANPHLKCLDFDEKHNEGKPIFEEWAKMIDPSIYGKLAIEKTRSNGYHVYFLCEHKANIHSIAANSTGQETIALRGDNFNGITYCAPTKGYTFIQKSLVELETLELDEMMQLVEVGYSFNRYNGKTITSSGGLKRYEVSRYPDPPIKYKKVFEIFDEQIEAMFIPELLVQRGWSYNDRTIERPRVSKEMGSFFEMYRPGKREEDKKTRSASYYYEKKRLSVYTDDQSVLLPSINNGEGLASWLSPFMVIYYLNGRDWEATYNEVLNVCDNYKIELPKKVPMVYAIPTRSNIRYNVEIKGIQDWAMDAGFMWMKMSADEDSPMRLIRVVNNVIFDVDESDLHKAYIDEVSRNYEEAEAQRVLIAFMPRIMQYMTILPLFNGSILRDKSDISYIPFNNGILEVSGSQVKLIKYGDLDLYVFARDIKDMDYSVATSSGKFVEFVQMITIDDGHYKLIKSVFGYLLHTYKKKSFAKAIMIIEDVDDQDEARGRSGKGLLAQFIKWIRSTIEQDGRNYKSDSQFKMQRISPWTQIFYLNDPGSIVMMQQFYNYITDDFLVELKGKKSYSIPFAKSPKILITTNFLPTLESDSDKDRFIVLPIKKVFTSSYRFQDAFPDQEFFSVDWSHFEKLSAINFAIECLQEYLKNGVYNYQNDAIDANKNRRLIQARVPGGLIDMLETALELTKNSVNEYDFETNLKPHDGLKDTSNSLIKCFEFDGKMLKIYTQHVYKYCINYHKMKQNDKAIGKAIGIFLTANGLEFEKSQNKNGRYFGVKIHYHEKKNLMIVHDSFHDSHDRNGWKSVVDDENPF